MLSTKMLPAAAVLYPMTFLTKSLGLFDTHFMVIVVLCLINLPIVIWMLFTYFKEIPKEIIEAGQMDGVNTWGEIKEILIPLAWGGIASTALLCFIFCWNEAYWTVRLTTIDAATLSKLIEGNRAPEGLFFGRLSAVSTAAIARLSSWLVLSKAAGSRPDIRSCQISVQRRPHRPDRQDLPCHRRCWWTSAPVRLRTSRPLVRHRLSRPMSRRLGLNGILRPTVPFDLLDAAGLVQDALPVGRRDQTGRGVQQRGHL